MSEKLEHLTLERKFTSEAKELKKLTIAEASYLAGVIDSDGTIVIGKSKREDSVSYRPRIVIGMISTTIIDLCNKYGGFWLYKPARRNDQPMYYWILTLQLIKHYLPQMIHHFQVKKDQAKLMLKVLRCCHGIGTAQDKKQLEKYYKKLKKLHHKSYPLPEKYRKIPQK